MNAAIGGANAVRARICLFPFDQHKRVPWGGADANLAKLEPAGKRPQDEAGIPAAYGYLPAKLFAKVQATFAERVKSDRTLRVARAGQPAQPGSKVICYLNVRKFVSIV